MVRRNFLSWSLGTQSEVLHYDNSPGWGSWGWAGSGSWQCSCHVWVLDTVSLIVPDVCGGYLLCDWKVHVSGFSDTMWYICRCGCLLAQIHYQFVPRGVLANRDCWLV
jgi:hypothetical protein